MKIYLDFETRSEIDIWKTGAWLYAKHPSTEILCAAYVLADGPVILRPKEELKLDNRMTALEVLVHDPAVLFVAHNAFFEQCIWQHIMVKKHGWEPIPIKRWRCTAAKACAYGLPKSLEKASLAMGLAHKKDIKGRQIMLRMCKPLPNKKGEIIYDNSPESYAALHKYCRRDVEVERELDNKLPDLSVAEQEIWFYDQLINSRGVRVDMDTVHSFIKILNSKTDSLNKQLELLTDGIITQGTQTAAMLNYLNAEGAKMTSINKQSVTEAMNSDRLNPKQIQILRLRQQLGKTSLAKYNTLNNAVDKDNILRDCFAYHVASTGRWGGKLVQLHNLPVSKINTDKAIKDINMFGYPAIEIMYPGKIMETLSACIRGMFIPNKGKELYIVDYGAIEARVLMWLAGETKGLKEFKATDMGTDEDIYVKMAQKIHNNYSFTKKNNPLERQLGKQAILGCGYGMGGDKFKKTCATYGIFVSKEMAQGIVGLYRTTYYRIKAYWYNIEAAMMEAYYNPNKSISCRNISWIYIKDRDAIFCQLPSKRILTYLSPKLEPNRFERMGMTFMTEVVSQWVRRDTYGGLLVENITQAVARDIMAYSIPRLERAGFPTLMHTHDEIVSQRPIGEEKISEMIDIMCKIPKWAVGCPIVAEGFTSMRYKKG